MKILSFLLLTYLLAANSFATERRETIDDLSLLPIRVSSESVSADVHYPNYRMGGGTPPTRAIQDCLILDIQDSDNFPSEELKELIARNIIVRQGFDQRHDDYEDLDPIRKGANIVFKLIPRNFYVQTLVVTTRSGEKLSDLLNKVIPPARLNNRPAQVNLIYVRDCRL